MVGKLLGSHRKWQGFRVELARFVIGYLLDELKNDPAWTGRAIDYVVTNPAIAGCALPSRRMRTATISQAAPTLTTQMKSVGEAMAIRRTIKESLQKCLCSQETR